MLLSTVYYYIHYNKSVVYESIVNQILTTVGGRYEKEVRSIVTNSARMIVMNAKGLMISRRKSSYTGNPQGISYKRMMELLSTLEQEEYLYNHIGGVEWNKSFEGGVVKTPSVIEFLPKWTSLFNGKNLKYFQPSCVEDHLIQIRDRSTKKLKPTRGVKGVKLMRKIVNDYNKALSSISVEYKGVPIATQSYKRVFSDDLFSGGRWYNQVGGVQLLGEAERRHITIDRCKTVELDFSAMHPRMILQGKGKQGVVDADFCPYSANLTTLDVDEDKVQWFKDTYNKDYDPVRNLIKMMVMIGLNAKNDLEGVFAVSAKLGEDKQKVGTDSESSCLYYGLHSKQNIRSVFDEVLNHNWEIAETFFADNGVYLQNKDSEILEDVIVSTLQDGEVLLPWHDGCLCKEEYADTLEQHMRDAWVKMYGDDTFCKIKRIA